MLYNWYAVDDSRGLAPAGWHVPTDEEWKQLEMYLGMSQSDANDDGFRGTYEGNKLKATSGWNSGGNGTNSSGFSALPGGYRYGNGSFYAVGNGGYLWSSSEFSSDNAWYRQCITLVQVSFATMTISLMGLVCVVLRISLSQRSVYGTFNYYLP